MKAFSLIRYEDRTGVSGTGRVAEGVVFSNGKVALCWQTDVSSLVVYDSIDDVTKIHGHAGSTAVVFHDMPRSEMVGEIVLAAAKAREITARWEKP